MNHTASKGMRVLFGINAALMWVMGIVGTLALVAGIPSMPVSAAPNGIYIATAAPHYKHPTTGKIEDPGGDGSSVLGQSMTESATYKKALVEVDPQGETYITIRLQLMDNIQHPQFQVDADRDGSFAAVSAALMQEDYTNNTADYRMKVPSETAILRCNMYVVAMGRDVIFYITVSDLQSGSGDFITSVKVEPTNAAPQQPTQPSEQPQQPTKLQEPTKSQQSSEVGQPTESPKSDAPLPSVGQPTSPDSPTPTEEGTSGEMPTSEEPVSATSGTGTPSEGEASAADASATSSVPKETIAAGLAEFDASGHRVTEAADEAESRPGSHTAVWWILGGVVVAVAAGVGVWYFGFFKKKLS